MADRLHLEIVTPSRRVVEVEVDEVRLPGALGEMGVLPGHIPLLTSLAAGPLTYFDGSSETKYAVQGGFAEVLPDRVTDRTKDSVQAGKTCYVPALLQGPRHRPSDCNTVECQTSFLMTCLINVLTS